MKREIIITSDGSTTIQIPSWNEQYHSKHGAIQEAYHVFIKNGLTQFQSNKEINILEVGFGTGLNCFITYLEAKKNGLNINYLGVEAYPVKENELGQLNYVTQLNAVPQKQIFDQLHMLSWDTKHQISTFFKLAKRKQDFRDIADIKTYNLIYFDAFGARVQPELWTEDIFAKMYRALKQKGILVTYSAKGSVRRIMEKVGFEVEKLSGPPGKRHMLRAIKK